MSSISDYFRDPVELDRLMTQLALRYVTVPGARRTSEIEQRFAQYVRGRNDVRIVLPQRDGEPLSVDWSQAQDPLRARVEFQREFFEALGKSFVLVPEIRSPRSHTGGNADRGEIERLTEMLDVSVDAVGFCGIVHPADDKKTLRRAYTILDDGLQKEMMRSFADIENRETQRFFEGIELKNARAGMPRGQREPMQGVYDRNTAVASLRAAYTLNGLKMRDSGKDATLEPQDLEGLLGNLARITRTPLNHARSDAGLQHLVADFAHWRLNRRNQGNALHIQANAQSDINLQQIAMEKELGQLTAFTRGAHAMLAEADPATKALLESQIEQSDKKIGILRVRLAGDEAVASAVRQSAEWRLGQVEFAQREAFVSEQEEAGRLRLPPDARYGNLMEESKIAEKRIKHAYESLLLAEDPSVAPLTRDLKLAGYDAIRAALRDRSELPDILEAYPAYASIALQDSHPEIAAKAQRIATDRATAADLADWKSALSLKLPIDAIHAAEWDEALLDNLPTGTLADARLLVAMLRTGNVERVTEIVTAGRAIAESLAKTLGDAEPSAPTPEALASIADLCDRIRKGESITKGQVREAAAANPGMLVFGSDDDHAAEIIARRIVGAADFAIAPSGLTASMTAENTLWKVFGGTPADRVDVDPALLHERIAAMAIVKSLGAQTGPGIADKVFDATVRGVVPAYDASALADALRSKSPLAVIEKLPAGELREGTAIAYVASTVRRAVSRAERELRAVDARIAWAENPEQIAALREQRTTILRKNEYMHPTLVDERSDRRSSIATDGAQLHVSRGKNERFGLPLVSERQNLVRECKGEVEGLSALVSTNDGQRMFVMPIGPNTNLRFDAREFGQTQSLSAFKIGDNLSVISVPVATISNGHTSTLVPVAEIDVTSFAGERSAPAADDPSLMLLAAYHIGTPVELSAHGLRAGLSLHLPQCERGDLRAHDARIARAGELVREVDLALRDGVTINDASLSQSLNKYLSRGETNLVEAVDAASRKAHPDRSFDLVSEAVAVLHNGVRSVDPKRLERADKMSAQEILAITDVDEMRATAKVYVASVAAHAIASTVEVVDELDRKIGQARAIEGGTVTIGEETLSVPEAAAYRSDLLATRPYLGVEPLPLQAMPNVQTQTPSALRRADVHTHPVPQLVGVTFTDREAPDGFVMAEERFPQEGQQSIWHQVPVEHAPTRIPSGGFLWVDPQPFAQGLVYRNQIQEHDPVARAYEHATLEHVRVSVGLDPTAKLMLINAENLTGLPETGVFKLGAFDDRSAYYVGSGRIVEGGNKVYPVVELPHVRKAMRIDHDGTVIKPNRVSERILDADLTLPTLATFEVQPTHSGHGTFVVNPDPEAREGLQPANRLTIQVTNAEGPWEIKRSDQRDWGVASIDAHTADVIFASDPTTGNAVTDLGAKRLLLKTIPRHEIESDVQVGDVGRFGMEEGRTDVTLPPRYTFLKPDDRQGAGVREGVGAQPRQAVIARS